MRVSIVGVGTVPLLRSERPLQHGDWDDLMSEDLSEESGEAAAPVTRVQVRADAFVYEGLVTLLPDNDRVQSVLNDPRPFLSMTDVNVFDASTGSTYSTPYLALNKGAITHVVLVAEGLTEGVAEG